MTDERIEARCSARVVLTTVASPEEAERLGRILVEERLAACATFVGGARSLYRWKDEIESARETLVVLKTNAEHLEALAARLHALHSYETPEFLVFGVEAGSERYLEWLEQALGPARGTSA